MVWIHGGGLIIGQSNDYDPTRLVDVGDVIVVTVNYRLGYLGFLEPGSRQHDIYTRHCDGAGSTFSLIVRGGEAEAFRLLDHLKLVKLAVSLGGTESLASHPAAMTHLSVAPARKASSIPTT